MDAMAANSTGRTLPPLPDYTLTPQPPLIAAIPDKYLALILPILAYWGVSLFFHWIDEKDFFPQYRLHTPAEVLKRNHVSRWEVFRDVILQQIIQTIFGVGMGYFDQDYLLGKEEHDIAVWAQRLRIAQTYIPGVLATAGLDTQGIAKTLAGTHAMLAAALSGGQYNLIQESVSGELLPAFAPWELAVAKAIYYALVPAIQFTMAILIVDTWQYFWHRAMHLNKWLYTTFHSRHHRLYVPYAYGALYNHPVEGFLLDTLGTGLAYLIVGMTPRQSMWFFTCSTIKTVDDHCGYVFPWDPLQHITSNNAGYHDVHHQSWGIKTNFSQPFFTFWDGLMGTKWSGGDVSARYSRAKLAAQAKLDAELAATARTDTVTKSLPQDSGIAASHPQPYEDDTATASPTARHAHLLSQHRLPIPAGKAQAQALGSRQQILDDTVGGGVQVLAEEAEEEREAQQEVQREVQQVLRRSPRKKNAPQPTTSTASPLKGLRGRVSGVNSSLHGRGSGVLGVESSR